MTPVAKEIKKAASAWDSFCGRANQAELDSQIQRSFFLHKISSERVPCWRSRAQVKISQFLVIHPSLVQIFSSQGISLNSDDKMRRQNG